MQGYVRSPYYTLLHIFPSFLSRYTSCGRRQKKTWCWMTRRFTTAFVLSPFLDDWHQRGWNRTRTGSRQSSHPRRFTPSGPRVDTKRRGTGQSYDVIDACVTQDPAPHFISSHLRATNAASRVLLSEVIVPAANKIDWGCVCVCGHAFVP